MDKQTDGRSDGRTRPVLRPIRTAVETLFVEGQSSVAACRPIQLAEAAASAACPGPGRRLSHVCGSVCGPPGVLLIANVHAASYQN